EAAAATAVADPAASIGDSRLSATRVKGEAVTGADVQGLATEEKSVGIDAKNTAAIKPGDDFANAMKQAGDPRQSADAANAPKSLQAQVQTATLSRELPAVAVTAVREQDIPATPIAAAIAPLQQAALDR